MSSSAGLVGIIVLVSGGVLLYAASKLHLPGPQSLSRVSHRQAPKAPPVRTSGGLGRFARQRTGEPAKLS